MWYSSKVLNPDGSYVSQYCLSSFKTSRQPDLYEDMVFTGESFLESLKPEKHHTQQVNEVLDSAQSCVPYMAEYIKKLVNYDDIIPEKLMPKNSKMVCRITPNNKPFYKMTSKELHWAVALVRSGLEYHFAYDTLCALDETHKTNFPKFLLWIIAHRYRGIIKDNSLSFTQCIAINHTMFSEFNMNIDLERIVGTFKDIVKRDLFPPVTTSYIYWSRVRYKKNVVDPADQCAFKRVVDIDPSTDNEKVWFTDIMQQVTLLQKYIGD